MVFINRTHITLGQGFNLDIDETCQGHHIHSTHIATINYLILNGRLIPPARSEAKEEQGGEISVVREGVELINLKQFG